jgi:hypothetical protein
MKGQQRQELVVVVWICLRGGEMARILLMWPLQVVSGKKTLLSLREGKVLAVLDIVVVVGGHKCWAKLPGLAIQGEQAICEQEVDILEADGIKMLPPAWLLSTGEPALE